MSRRRGNTRYPHAFSKGRSRPWVHEGSWQQVRPILMSKPDKPNTLASLIESGQALHIRCIPCGKQRYLSALEAVASYGGLLSFAELRAVLQARCRQACQLTAEPSIRSPDELEVKRRSAPP